MEEEVFETKTIAISRVTKVTAGGKNLRFRVVVVSGNKNGKVGVGVAKGRDIPEATQKATLQAMKNLIEVPLKDGTIPFEVEAKYCSSRILFKPQKKGRGIIAGGPIKILCELAGIKDITSKVLSRSTNKINLLRAAIKALSKLKDEIDIISRRKENAASSNKTENKA